MLTLERLAFYTILATFSSHYYKCYFYLIAKLNTVINKYSLTLEHFCNVWIGSTVGDCFPVI